MAHLEGKEVGSLTREDLRVLDEYLSARRRVIEDYRSAGVALDTALAVPDSFNEHQVANRQETFRRARARYEEEFGSRMPTLTPDEEDALVRVEGGGWLFGPSKRNLRLVCGALRRLTNSP